MYLIQQTTKKPADEILGFFYDFGTEIARIGVEKMDGRSIRKDIQDIYPGTDIPFKILVTGRKYTYGDDPHFGALIEITFPDNPTYINTDKMMEAITERQLLGGAALPDFEKPTSRTPKMYRDLIEQVIKGKISINEESREKT